MMNEDQARAAIIKQTRREILRALNMMYAIGPLSFESICAALSHLELPGEAYVRNDVKYLCEKGYAQWTNERPMLDWPLRLYQLTATGKELVDKITVDPTLEP